MRPGTPGVRSVDSLTVRGRSLPKVSNPERIVLETRPPHPPRPGRSWPSSRQLGRRLWLRLGLRGHMRTAHTTTDVQTSSSRSLVREASARRACACARRSSGLRLHGGNVENKTKKWRRPLMRRRFGALLEESTSVLGLQDEFESFASKPGLDTNSFPQNFTSFHRSWDFHDRSADFVT